MPNQGVGDRPDDCLLQNRCQRVSHGSALLDAGNVHDGVKGTLALGGIFDVCIDEERACFEGDVYSSGSI
jgi:hypothetical protein